MGASVGAAVGEVVLVETAEETAEESADLPQLHNRDAKLRMIKESQLLFHDYLLYKS